MITDLNLGPSIRTSDLGPSKSKEKLDLLQPESSARGADSFDQTLQSKLAKDKNGKPETEKKQENQPRMATEKKSTTDRSEKSERSEEGRDEAAGSVRKKEKSKETKEASKKAPSDESTRESVMLQFMDSIESELGIPPERMLEAMTNLTSADAESSPEDSASQVIAQLQLPPDQADKAYQMYTQMLGDLNQLQQPQSVKPGILAAVAVPATVMSLKDRKGLLNNSLDRMNSNFFMRQELMSQGTQVGPAAEMTELSNDMMPVDRMPLGLGRDLPNNMPMMDRPLPENAMPKDPQPANPEAMTGMSAETTDSMKKLAEKLALLGATAGAIDKSIQADPQNMQALKVEQWLKNQGIDNPAAGAAAVGALAGGAGMGALGQDDSEDSKGDLGGNSSGDPLANLGQVSGQKAGPENSNFAGALAGAGTAAGTAKAGEGAETNQASLNQIMQQAKFMIKKGGGESVVKMSPEGLGNMHMKIMVQDGKVSVEMATDNKEAKKLIESSVNDLRLGLGAHKLTVDSIKVDVNSNLSDNKSDQQPQKQMGQGPDQGKDQARQFMGQFREENMGRRDNAFWDSPGLRAYSSNRSVDPLKPAEPDASVQKRSVGINKGSGLDLVA